MERVYTGEELAKETKIKKTMMAWWYVALGVYVALTAGFITWFLLLDYEDPLAIWMQVIECAVTGLFGVASFLFFSIPFKRQRRYVKLLGYLDTGLKEFGEGKFLRFSDEIEVRESVDFNHMITEEWSERRQEFLERKVLLDMEKPRPAVQAGDMIMYKTQGNVLIEYEVKLTETQTDKTADETA